MRKRKILKYIIGGCIIGIAMFTVVSLVRCINKESKVPKKTSSIRPESKEWLLENSQVISYIEILEVDKIIEKRDTEPLPPGVHPIFREQRAQVKFLKILKGPEELETTIGEVIKNRSHFYLTKRERLVLYLKKENGLYYTIGDFGGEWRLASALANINNLKESMGSGIVVGILNKENLLDLKLRILQGRYKAPIIPNSKVWRANLIKTEKVGTFDVTEISLKPGAYTILLELKKNLYSFSRLVNGYYPYVILKENNWRSLYFDVKRIK